MNLRRAGVVLAKELTDVLRDRRTALSILLISIAVGPAVLFFFGKWISQQEAKVERRIVHAVNIDAAPSFANFLARQDVTVKAPEGDPVTLVTGGKLDAVLVLPEDFEAGLASGDAPTVEVIYDGTRAAAQATVNATREYVRAFNKELGTLRLLARGVSPQVMVAVKIENSDQASERRRAAAALLFLQISALMAVIVGGMAAATDLTAGERERGSLEPLLMNPVTPLTLVGGKAAAVTLYALAVAFLTLSGYWVALKYLPPAFSALKFGGPEFVRFMLLIVPFALLLSSVQLLIAAIAKTYKEAQTYLSYLSVGVSFAPVLGFFLEWQDQPWQRLVPILGQNAGFLKVLGGDELSVIDYLLPGGVAVGLSALALVGLAKLLTRERIVFGR
jgi:sodium transport system permease protein